MKANKIIISFKIMYFLIFLISTSYIQTGIIKVEEGPLTIGHLIMASVTFPLGIISYLYEPLIQYFVEFLKYIGVFNILIEDKNISKLLAVNIFSFSTGMLGYYQWFIWLPKYIKNKKGDK